MVFNLGLTSFWVSQVLTTSKKGLRNKEIEGMIKDFLDTKEVTFHLVGLTDTVISYSLLCKKTKSVCIIHTTYKDVEKSSEEYLAMLGTLFINPEDYEIVQEGTNRA